ncbi:MAG: M28 family metallopeptidase [Actinomycetota bacterium]|nr:M28 family metallopeptidase [Actinomycetota bacterium]
MSRRTHRPSSPVEEAVDREFMRSLVEQMSAIGSSPLGFRVAGTPEDDEVCALVADTMRAIGLEDVLLEPVPVDGWRFRRASLHVAGESFACASFGGSPPTPPGGVEGELVFAGRGSRAELVRTGVNGKIVLFDWPGDHLLWPSLTAAQATQEGALAVVCACLPGGRYYQAEGALGAFDGIWIEGSVPLATIAGDHAIRLIEEQRSGPVRARLTLDIELLPGAIAHNTAGTLRGRRAGPPIVVAGHHDGWFFGSFDDATGVAATLGIAKAMLDSGHLPERPIVFGSHTAEEYGLADSAFDWLIGASWRINEEHRDWGRTAPFYLNIEGSGMPLPMFIDTPPELRRFCRRVCASARRDGLLPYGVRYGTPRTGTEQWPYLAAGIPSLNVNTLPRSYWRTEYHTQYDTTEIISFADLVRETRLYARFVMAADASLADMLDLPSRAADVRRHGRLDAARAAGFEVAHVERALTRFHKAAHGDAGWPATRAAFATVARTLESIHARDKQATLHSQALTDIESLDAALAALERGNSGAAARAASRSGRNRLARHVGREVFALDARRHRPGHPGYGWAANARTTPTPGLWEELASLRREPGSRPPGPWLARSLAGKRASSARELQRRLDHIAAAFERAADQLEPRPT